MSLPDLQRALDALLSGVTARIGRILDRSMAGEDNITVEEGAPTGCAKAKPDNETPE
jgi:hypothetical protein